MHETKSETADISVKLNVKVIERMDPENGEVYQHPHFDHKITSVIQMKNETQGLSDYGYELIFDNDENIFRVVKRNEQLSLI